MTDHDRYCIEICKAKCCYTHEGKPCKNLSDNRCAIHHLWRDNWCHYREGNVITAPIEYIIAKKLLPDNVLNQCCYAHPELLEVLNGSKHNS